MPNAAISPPSALFSPIAWKACFVDFSRFNGRSIDTSTRDFLLESMTVIDDMSVGADPAAGAARCGAVRPEFQGALRQMIGISSTSRCATAIPSPMFCHRLAGVRVLVAEDHPDHQRLFTFMLRREGADVEIVDNGRSAIQRAVEARQLGMPFDAVLMDLQMPHPRRLRRHPCPAPARLRSANRSDQRPRHGRRTRKMPRLRLRRLRQQTRGPPTPRRIAGATRSPRAPRLAVGPGTYSFTFFSGMGGDGPLIRSGTAGILISITSGRP